MARAARQWSHNPVLDFAILQLKWYLRSRGALYTSCNAINSTINGISNAFPGNYSHALKRKGAQSETGINLPLCLLKGCFNVSCQDHVLPSVSGIWADSLPLRGKKHFACPPTHHQKARIHVSWAMGRRTSLLPSASPISLGWLAQNPHIHICFSAAASALALRAGLCNHLRLGKVLLQKKKPPWITPQPHR